MPISVLVEKWLTALSGRPWHPGGAPARELAVFDRDHRSDTGYCAVLRCEVDVEDQFEARLIAVQRARLVRDRGAWGDPKATRALWPEFDA